MGLILDQGLVAADSRALALLDHDGGDGKWEIPDAPIVRAILGAIMAAGPQASQSGWTPAGQCIANVQRVGLEKIELRLEAAHQEHAWRVIEGMTPLALDILGLLLSRPGPGPLRTRLVSMREVLDLKGYRRWGDERRTLERQLASDLNALRRLSVGAGGELLFKLSPIERDGCEFIYEPSDWLQGLMVTAPLRPLRERILRFDHRCNRGADVLAKKLAIYFSLSTPGRGAVRRVESVLQAIGACPRQLASRDGRGGRFADRFDEALLRLQDQGLFSVRLRSAPQGLDRVKGWLSRWLDGELVIQRLDESPRSARSQPGAPPARSAEPRI